MNNNKNRIVAYRVEIFMDIPVGGNNGDGYPNDEAGLEAAKMEALQHKMPEEYVPDSIKLTRVIVKRPGRQKPSRHNKKDA